MASIFLAYSPADEPLNLPDSTWAAVRAAMLERCPGPLRECGTGPLRCLVGGRDGAAVGTPDAFVVADGYPVAPEHGGNHRYVDSLQALAEDWRKRRHAVLPCLDGSFSLWFFDHGARELMLVRDRFGSRPLYWVASDGWIFTASECKVLAALGIPLRFSQSVLEEVLVCRWIVGGAHLLTPLQQVPASSAVTFGPEDGGVPSKYWDLSFAPEKASVGALTHFRDLTRNALRQSISDVANGKKKVGVLMSGGVDSSVIAAAARETVDQCVGFAARIPGAPNVELERALSVARHLDIECRVVDIVPPRFPDDLRTMVRRMEEPPRHPNNFVLGQLYERAASEVDLVLQGDGAEMLFGLSDVSRVARFRRKRALVSHFPDAARNLTARGLWRLGNRKADRLARLLVWDATTYAAMLDAIAYSPAVRRSLRHLFEYEAPEFLPVDVFSQHGDFSDALQAYQTFTFLTPSLLRHDRLAQPLGLTTESPFLRLPVVGVACSLPRALRYTDGPKPALRALCDFYLPPEVSRWPKLGFPVPWKNWMRPSRPPEEAPVGTRIDGLLPDGFLEAAGEEDDAEAYWTAWTLELLSEEFGVQISFPNSVQ